MSLNIRKKFISKLTLISLVFILSWDYYNLIFAVWSHSQNAKSSDFSNGENFELEGLLNKNCHYLTFVILEVKEPIGFRSLQQNTNKTIRAKIILNTLTIIERNRKIRRSLWTYVKSVLANKNYWKFLWKI